MKLSCSKFTFMVSRYTNQAYDEAYEVEDDESELSEEEEQSISPSSGTLPKPRTAAHMSPSHDDHDDHFAESQTPSSSSSTHHEFYNPADYAHLPVSAEVKELFNYITRFKPSPVPIEAPLRPFLPDFVPAVGEVDAFLKVPRPDGKPDGLGTARLDEPSAVESDRALLTLQLKKALKVEFSDVEEHLGVKRLHNAEQHADEVDKWIDDVKKMHADLPLPTIQYSRRMPDLEALMQVWPIEVEAHLAANPLTEYIDQLTDFSTTELAKIVCSLLDVPVHNGHIIESLHVLFSLYAQVRSNQHFIAASN